MLLIHILIACLRVCMTQLRLPRRSLLCKAAQSNIVSHMSGMRDLLLATGCTSCLSWQAACATVCGPWLPASQVISRPDNMYLSINLVTMTASLCTPQHICFSALQAEAALAYFLRGLMELCIYPPRPAQASFPQSKSQPELREDNVEAGIAPEGDASPLIDCDQPGQYGSRCRQQRHDSAPLSASCTDEAIRKVIQDRDPTHQGLPNQAAVRLLLSLLHWNPANRPTAAEALRHAFFALPLDSELTIACHTDRNLIGWC